MPRIILNPMQRSVPITNPAARLRVDGLFSLVVERYGEGAPPPNVRMLDHTIMANAVAMFVPTDGTVWGWYCFAYPDTIFLSSRLNLERSKFAQCTLVHEMVHYLQFNTSRYSDILPFEQSHILMLEREADDIMEWYDALVSGATPPPL
jgi:hypothetical protein